MRHSGTAANRASGGSRRQNASIRSHHSRGCATRAAASAHRARRRDVPPKDGLEAASRFSSVADTCPVLREFLLRGRKRIRLARQMTTKRDDDHNKRSGEERRQPAEHGESGRFPRRDTPV